MTQASPPPGARRWGWGLGALAVVLLLIVGLVLVVRPGPEPSPPPEGGPSTTESTLGPPSAEEPMVTQENATLTVPDTLRLEPQDFEADEGATYLLEFEATTSKPEDSPGDAMYFGASLACSGPEEGTLRSVGGTQNVRTGETVTIRNQFLLTIETPGRHLCRISLNSPNEDAAAKGTTAEITSTWSATMLEEPAFEARADQRLPRVVDSGDRALAFRYETDLDDLRQRRIDLLSTLHLTTCTGVNGSRENGRAWCDEESVDLDGSTLEVSYRADVVDARGEVCDTRTLASTRTSIVRFTHHRVMHQDLSTREPLSSCGDTVALHVVVENFGPAPVVIHQSNSTLLALVAE